MRRFIAGLALGLTLAGTGPIIAEWGMSDEDKLGQLVVSGRGAATALYRIAGALERLVPSLEWQARSLERITRAQEKIANCCACPAERPRP